jgi:hypothetical protein
MPSPLRFLLAALFTLVLTPTTTSQTASTGVFRGSVLAPHDLAVAAASVVAVNSATAARYAATADAEGRYAISLPPGDYTARAVGHGFSPQVTRAFHVEVGGATELDFHLSIAGPEERVTVSGEPALVETRASGISTVLDERALNDLPLNGRRFSDLMLLSPGVTQDPRGLTSATSGDLSFGGIRGFQNSFLVDGGDFNNGFYAQALGRYRAPYQFSTEVVQEFRVSSNSYSAEMGRSGGAVVNVITRSGSNHPHGSAFYYFRDGMMSATGAFLTFKPPDRQQQLGLTIGGPIKQNKVFFFAGFDQHIFHVPAVVEFLNGSTVVVPQAGTGPYTPGDYDASDQALVFATADGLTALAGQHQASQIGNSSFGKLDVWLSQRQQLALRYNATRYWGSNNVFLDPASPVTYDATSDNGQETVATDTAAVSLTSALSSHLSSHLHAQFSRDWQQSYSNSTDTLTKIPNWLDGIGRSNLLPRASRQNRLHFSETLDLEGPRHSLKLGGDVMLTSIYDFFPSQQAGEYLFYPIKVNPFTYQPMESGLPLTPLRAYAHQMPHYYIQSFGNPVSHPGSNDYAAFAQDSMRVSDHLAVNLGVRWDLQTFSTAGLISNPLFPPSGRVPFQPANVAPRAGLAYSLGSVRPLVIRAGYGLFYVRIPQIYNSAVATENGITNGEVFLNNTHYYDQLVFPVYPNPLVRCSLAAVTCSLPDGFTQGVTRHISAFSPRFVTPRVQQASLSVEREVAPQTTLTLSYLFVRGEHLIRAVDVNLPQPLALTYPLFDITGTVFQNGYYTVDSFATWQFTQSLTCPFPPCINPLGRPLAQLGAIYEFQTAASSIYHGATLALNRHVSRGTYLRLAYTYARAIDDGQDALVAGQPATVQNSYAPSAERGLSSTDQRQRLVFAFSADPRPFHRENPMLGKLFNDWKLSSITSAGSGRPFTASVQGDANQDGNGLNDRLPGYRRNSFTGPNYFSTDLRLTRQFNLHERYKLELTAESFNLFNRANKRVAITSSSFTSQAATFVQGNVTTGNTYYPGYYQQPANSLKPNAAYAPRQMQLGVKFAY